MERKADDYRRRAQEAEEAAQKTPDAVAKSNKSSLCPLTIHKMLPDRGLLPIPRQDSHVGESGQPLRATFRRLHRGDRLMSDAF
jgi:hypothetical protein